MPVNRTRAPDRWAGLVGALLVQLVVLGLFLEPLVPPARPRVPARELMLLLHPAPQAAPAPRTIDARPVPLLPLASLPTPEVRQDSASAVPPSASALQGLGQSLFGCALEAYAGLSRQERAHCPPPGEGLARGEPSDLIGPSKPHAKDAQRWQEALDERHWEPQCAGAESVVSCLVQQSIAEHKRAEAVHKDLAWQKSKALQPPKPVLPNRIGVYREETRPPPDAR